MGGQQTGECRGELGKGCRALPGRLKVMEVFLQGHYGLYFMGQSELSQTTVGPAGCNARPSTVRDRPEMSTVGSMRLK